MRQREGVLDMLCMFKEHIIPGSYRNLGNHKDGLVGIPTVEYLKEVTAFVNIQVHQPKIIYSKQVICCILVKYFLVIIQFFSL